MGRFSWRRSRPYATYIILSLTFCAHTLIITALASFPTQPVPTTTSIKPKTHKNWDGITTDILKSDKEKSTEEDPNVGGDSTLNSFFQKIYGDADPDTQRAMMKSYMESGGTTLSTNWDEVGKGNVDVKPPSGSQWKNWG